MLNISDLYLYQTNKQIIMNTTTTNKVTGMTTETNHVLNWYKIFDTDGHLVIQGPTKN